jgi:divinyl chlorophyllide a 8-vinyl-reductase
MDDPMDEAPRTVLLAGATGTIGRAVAAELTERGYRVLAPVRDRSRASESESLQGCELLEAALTDGADLERALAGRTADAVISCIASRTGEAADAWRVDYEANRKLLRAARDLGARHFVLLSAICVQKPRLAFQHAKLAFEKELQASELDHSIVRPTAFFKSLSGQVDRVRRGKPFIVFGNGTLTACKPIGERDLARYLADCLDKSELRNRVLPIGGSEAALTPREQGALLFELTGQAPRYRQVPVGLFDLAGGLLAPLARLSPKLAAKAELARIGRYYATESMLVWDAEHGRYDAEATPGIGTQTLREHYRRLLRQPPGADELGDHKLF